MARPFMTPEAMLARREMAVRLRRDEDLSYREIGRRLGCSHTAARLFVAEPDKPLVWDPRGTRGRKWDAGDAQDRVVERRRQKLLAAGVDAPEEEEAPRPITTADLHDRPVPPTVSVPPAHPAGQPVWIDWATPDNRRRVAAYVEADSRRLVTTAALFTHCRLVAEDEDDGAVVRRQLEGVLQAWGYVLGADGGWRQA